MLVILHSPASGVHVAAALLALVAGTYIMATPKGTRRHRWVGRMYVGSMVVLLATAFRIYFLFGRFGIVHWGALGSVCTLLVGIGAIALRPVLRAWLRWHYLGMGASVLSLYAAFLVESTYRFFSPAYFWWVTLGPAAVLIIGSWLLHNNLPARAG